ncbi:MAG: NAD(+)/NADH kinase [Candidatus Heimdallarchaeota archaeon]|nr:NAD(+)/NADH kinase [Candidatus Heimdallarchaeota archaeon]
MSMSKFQKIAVVSRSDKEQIIELSKKIVKLLQEKYFLDVYLNEPFSEVMNYPQSFSMKKLKDFDLVIALGGDGTILWTARHAHEVPIFGINAGYLGFLTTATLENSETGIERIMKGDFVVERCMRLKSLLDSKELPTALNEIYTTNEQNAKICALNIHVDGYNLGCHRLDGLLVSTPVGSTAYALSAGGSIIEPNIKAMQIVPVNSVMRRIRPFVVPGSSKITITLPEDNDKEVVAVIDGDKGRKFEHDSILEITKAENETVFLRFPDHGFFNRLQDKLGF